MGGKKIKNKDQLSLAEARVEAELGNKECVHYKKPKEKNLGDLSCGHISSLCSIPQHFRFLNWSLF